MKKYVKQKRNISIMSTFILYIIVCQLNISSSTKLTFLGNNYAFAADITNEDHLNNSNKDNHDTDLEKWLKDNNLRVMDYLTKLSEKDRYKVLRGVLLTDGTQEMLNYVFLGKANDIGKGVHLYIFEYKRKRSAYIWVDKDGIEFQLPQCSKYPGNDSLESAYVLSGDIYTMKSIQPGSDIIHVMCVKNSWIRKANISIPNKEKHR